MFFSLLNRLQSIPYFFTVFINPVFGLLVDVWGHRTLLLFLSTLNLMLAHFLLYSAALGAVVPLLLGTSAVA
jgi:hypothetical protein